MTNEELKKIENRIIELKQLSIQALDNIKAYPSMHCYQEELVRYSKEIVGLHKKLKKAEKEAKKKELKSLKKK